MSDWNYTMGLASTDPYQRRRGEWFRSLRSEMAPAQRCLYRLELNSGSEDDLWIEVWKILDEGGLGLQLVMEACLSRDLLDLVNDVIETWNRVRGQAHEVQPDYE